MLIKLSSHFGRKSPFLNSYNLQYIKSIFFSQISKKFSKNIKSKELSKVSKSNEEIDNFMKDNEKIDSEKKVYNEKFKEKFTLLSEREKRRSLLSQEITTNPEFFNAFPHLKEGLDLFSNIDPEVGANIPLEPEKQTDYFNSLLNSYNDYESKNTDEMERENADVFLDAYSRKDGPRRLMSKEEKERVHQTISEKMQELEDTGLSREEILFNKPVGFPLSQDRFFQYLKNNKIAREMLIKPTQAFAADTVIEIALKQDIGIDPGLGVVENYVKTEEELDPNYRFRLNQKLANKKYKDESMNSDMYDYKTNYLNKIELQYNATKTKPKSFVQTPMTRSLLRKKYMIKTIKKSDVHWKNIPLLVKFINEGGKMLNRFQTRLPTNIHRRLAKTVKHARNLGFLPHNDYIKPTDKIPITSNYSMFYEDTAKIVDPITGTIKVVHNPSEEDKFSYASFNSSSEAKEEMLKSREVEEFKKGLKLDTSSMPYHPDNDQRDWIIAQNYLHRRENNITISNDANLLKVEKECSDNARNLVNQHISMQNIVEAYIYEKGYGISDLKDIEKLSIPNAKKKSNYSAEKDSFINEINNIIESSDLLKTRIPKEKKIQVEIDPMVDASNYGDVFKYKRATFRNKLTKKTKKNISPML